MTWGMGLLIGLALSAIQGAILYIAMRRKTERVFSDHQADDRYFERRDALLLETIEQVRLRDQERLERLRDELGKAIRDPDEGVRTQAIDEIIVANEKVITDTELFLRRIEEDLKKV